MILKFRMSSIERRVFEHVRNEDSRAPVDLENSESFYSKSFYSLTQDSSSGDRKARPNGTKKKERKKR